MYVYCYTEYTIYTYSCMYMYLSESVLFLSPLSTSSMFPSKSSSISKASSSSSPPFSLSFLFPSSPFPPGSYIHTHNHKTPTNMNTNQSILIHFVINIPGAFSFIKPSCFNIHELTAFCWTIITVSIILRSTETLNGSVK